ncbi:AAA-12 domain-containing protein [Mycena indigotica]|uniref:AAA-12 domain-containing protein n=1 Tax=Mycena indigotica TaxID=2126181 RepID=A0A8H6TGV6_9AGAR|nr:AAA-12 domain-containing protein [Mycena indigotica]KAF7315520.1 AAA-12 domain-containing protein [Mycena indigotica]
MSPFSLSATKLAEYHHFNCDLYLHDAFHRDTRGPPGGVVSETAQANFQRGVDWERACLFPYLDRENLLLTIPPRPIDSAVLAANIEADDRAHFFVSGVEFWPPMDKLRARFSKAGTDPVQFGLAKPDLIEITREPGGHVVWRVIDAKASKAVKTSHHVQIYFYHLCLSLLLPGPLFEPADDAAIWLPPAEGFDEETCPSMDDLHSIDINLLAPSLDDFLFRKLPRIVSQPREEIPWHLNPLCRGCPFEAGCTQRTVDEGRLGVMPNISLAQVEVLRTMLGVSSSGGSGTTDIEDLHRLLGDSNEMRKLELSHPSTARKAKRILAMRKSAATSPALEAARTRAVQVIPRRNFTFPRREDVSVVISVVIDPSSSKQRIATFCISVFSCIPTLAWEPVSGPESAFIETLSSLLNNILSLNEYVKPTPLTQIYVFSSSEEAAIRAHLIEAALTSSSVSDGNLRLCLGTLVDGAALLQTNFQPLVLSVALLSFNKSQFKRHALQILLERMDLPITGTIDEMRARIEAKIQELQTQGGSDDKRTEMGQLPRVVVLKKEIESLLALPVPGYWDLAECAHVLLPAGSCDRACPTEEDILAIYRRETKADTLVERLEQRNASIYAVLQETRRRVVGFKGTMLVNVAKPLKAEFLDICHEPNLRKLFFMQQFEVLAKLSDLWKSRIDGCPDAPVLEYHGTTAQGTHAFYLISGNIDISGSKERSFYDYLLVEDETDVTGVPPEALFDDLSLAGCLFPVTHAVRAQRWDTQSAVVVAKVAVADVCDVLLVQARTRVVLKIWGKSPSAFLRRGAHYRLSPRLVDFNTSKVLSTLLELDVKASTHFELSSVPFLQLVVDPRSFASDTRGKELVKKEAGIQSAFRQLRDLGTGPDDPAGALVLKASQHRAVQRILSNRLAVLWGPPGTGKTYTIALALLRLLEAYHRLGDKRQHIVFITAMTHAAIDAVEKKLVHLIACYKAIDGLPVEWLDHLRLERVLKGNEQAPPPASGSVFYLGTVYQLYNFSKRYNFQVDMCVIDEAGQLALSSAALVLRSLAPAGRIVVAGDSQQLAPILTGTYPNRFLFGSILDGLMQLSKLPVSGHHPLPSSPTASDYSASQDTIVQLTENFRLNPDLGEFVATIYARAFKPQKAQTRLLAAQLARLEEAAAEEDGPAGPVRRDVQVYLLALSAVMRRRRQIALQAPRIKTAQRRVAGDESVPHAVSLALIRLQTTSRRPEGVGYEAHVRGEAVLAAAVVAALQRCCPLEDIFVATPHRIQRQAVKAALREQQQVDDLAEQMEGLGLSEEASSGTRGTVTVDTVERLQGSEAGFVICLFSLPPSATPDLAFLLERRRLNVAISRAKTLCILVSSATVLRPPVGVLANVGTAQGYAFLRAFEDRAWAGKIEVDVDAL